jgi:GxGYxYP putative glycoside hydrolase C-terminal domain/GxGYxY sequence motif in domain of unknown function N-terminal/F5/8 type C domain
MSGKMVGRGVWGGVALLMAASPCGAAESSVVNRYTPYPRVTTPTEGISWPKGQALPVFAKPADTLDTIMVHMLDKDEQITFSALQGLVNRKQPRIHFFQARAEEGMTTWADTPTVGLTNRNAFDRDRKYDLLAKYAGEIAGVVLYDPEQSPHYRNLAGTIAPRKRAIPVTAAVLEKMEANGIRLPVLDDLTQLGLRSAVEIYQHLYDHHWKDGEKRLIVSAKPLDERGGGDYHHTRDIAAAVGAAVLWLDCRIPEEKAVFRKFLGDMKAGEAVVLGWYTSERSGITTVSEFGIGTLPADFYVSGSVFSGTDHRIRIPAVPKMPALENKVYVSLIISDGDNIQYTQHAMRKVWDRTASIRGGFPLNWTIAPGLVDIGPGIMNYYYSTATPNDCFVTGPSGMGYMMPYNTLEEPGAPVGEHLKDPTRMDGYARLTETYLQRSGLRVITIWDDATSMHRASYEKHCRHLYGATVQNFKDVPAVAGGVTGDRVRFDKLVIPYAGSYEHLYGSLSRQIRRWDGKEPLFLSYQADIWGELKPDRLVEIHANLMKEFPGKLAFTRADHYFNLSNRAAGLPYGLTLSSDTTVKSGDPAAGLEAVTDGTPATLWTAEKPGEAWLGFDFGAARRISRCVIRHAGDQGMDAAANNRTIRIQAGTDGKSWKTVYQIKDNTLDVTDVDFPAISARYVRIHLGGATLDGKARAADVEIHGSDR